MALDYTPAAQGVYGEGNEADGCCSGIGKSFAGRFWPYASPQPRLALPRQGVATAS